MIIKEVVLSQSYYDFEERLIVGRYYYERRVRTFANLPV